MAGVKYARGLRGVKEAIPRWRGRGAAPPLGPTLILVSYFMHLLILPRRVRDTLHIGVSILLLNLLVLV